MIKTREEIVTLKNENRGDKVINSLLMTMLGTLDRMTQNPTENDILMTVKSTIKSCREMLIELGAAYDASNDERYVDGIQDTTKEIEFLEQFLPKYMSEEQLIEILLYSGITDLNMKTGMIYLKENYKDQYEGKTASIAINKVVNFKKS